MIRRRFKLAARREALGLTQGAVAERTGVDESTYQRWEAGTAKPSTRFHRKLAQALGVPPEAIESLLVLQTEEEALASGELPTPTLLNDIWTDEVSHLDLRRLIRARFGEMESMLVYRTLSVDIDIKNRQGDAKIGYRYELINCGSAPILGETKSVWFENQSEVAIEPTACDRGPCLIRVRRNYPNVKHFFCSFPEAVMPGESISYGFSYQVSRMFTQNHYWDQIVSHLARHLVVKIRHNKGFPFLSAHVEKESLSGLSIESNPDMSIKCSPTGCLDLTFRQLFPEAQSKYSLHWAFDESAP